MRTSQLQISGLNVFKLGLIAKKKKIKEKLKNWTLLEIFTVEIKYFQILFDYKKAIKKSYSLTGFAYGLAYTAAANKNIGTQAVVAQFMDYVVNECATEQAAKLGYAKLSGALLALADKQIALIK